MKNAVAAVICSVGALATLAPVVNAAEWPSHPVKLVVPYPPGSGPDTMARAVADRLGRAVSQPVIVDNRPGANGMIGTSAVVNAAPDGNTLLVVDRADLISNPLLMNQVPYQWETDLRPVTSLAAVDLFVLVNTKSPWQSFQKLIDYARENPQKINFGSAGNGGVSHVAQELVARGEGVQFTHVPYPGGARAVTALMAGEVDALVIGPVLTRGPIKEGRLNAVAVGTEQRSDVLPDVPTIREAGGGAYQLPSTVFVLMAPGKTPTQTVDRVQAEIQKIINDPSFAAQIKAHGLSPFASTPAETLEGIMSIKVPYEAVIKTSGAK